MKINRYVSKDIRIFLEKKMVLLSGPRQVGKTFLAKHFLSKDFAYFNYDDEEDRKVIYEKSWPRDKELIILDELHKMDKWKIWLKSICDREGTKPKIIVTGSARMDVFKKGGDSLAGRHVQVRLHPLSLRELRDNKLEKDGFNKFLTLSSFPEPFLDNDLRLSKVWRKNHLDRVIKEDLLDLERVTQLKKIEILVGLLSERVGNIISHASLARDLEVSSHTIKHWLQILEDLYVVFKVSPMSKDISKSLLKASKYYFYDIGRVKTDEGGKVENLVALHLIKRNHYLEDIQGETPSLAFIRDKLKREVDFVTLLDGKIEMLIEVKNSDNTPSQSLRYFKERLLVKKAYQIVNNLKREKDIDGIQIRGLEAFLLNLEV